MLLLDSSEETALRECVWVDCCERFLIGRTLRGKTLLPRCSRASTINVNVCRIGMSTENAGFLLPPSALQLQVEQVDVPDPAVKREVAEMRLQQCAMRRVNCSKAVCFGSRAMLSRRMIPACCLRYKRHVLTISEFFKNSAALLVRVREGHQWARKVVLPVASGAPH